MPDRQELHEHDAGEWAIGESASRFYPNWRGMSGPVPRLLTPPSATSESNGTNVMNCSKDTGDAQPTGTISPDVDDAGRSYFKSTVLEEVEKCKLMLVS